MREKGLITEEIYKQLTGLGITKQQLWEMPKEDILGLMFGQITSPVTVEMDDGEGQKRTLLARLQIVKREDGSPELKVYPHIQEIQRKELGLSKRETERLKEQGVIYTELKIGEQRHRCFVQLDRETNTLMYAKADDIGLCFPSAIHGVELTREERDAVREGKLVEVIVNDSTYTIGIDLKKEGGFKVIKGRREEWDTLRV